MFCEKCGSEIKEDSKFCPNCGRGIGRQNDDAEHISEKPKKLERPVEWKSEAITVILAIILTGLGHFYINHFKRGAVFLGIGLILLVISFVNPFVSIISIPFWIFNIYDAYKKCKFYNNYLEENGKKLEW